MIQKPLDDIEFEDFQALIDNKVAESSTIDYKTLHDFKPGKSSAELLKDICAMANTDGGDLIIGVQTDRKETDIPEKIVGITLENKDEKILGLESLIREGLEPTLKVGIKSYPLSGENNKFILLIRITKSWNGPHRVIYRNDDSNKIIRHFYARNSKGNYPMEIHEIKNNFLANETVVQEMKNFRLERIDCIKQGRNIPAPIPIGIIFLLHLIPIRAFYLGENYDLSYYHNQVRNDELVPIGFPCPGAARHFINFDGVLIDSPDDDNNSVGYVQLYRNGIIEVVDTYFIKDQASDSYNRGRLKLDSFEPELIMALKKYFLVFKRLGIQPPLYVGLSILKAKGNMLSVDICHRGGLRKIDREELIVPELELKDFELPIERLLKTRLDMFWQAGGRTKSENYNEQGEFISSLTK